MNIGSLENKYDNERIFMIGNGPSLTDTPIEQLSSEYTFALNRIDDIYESCSWRPSFYFHTWDNLKKRDEEAIQRHIDLGIPCFITSEQQDNLPNESNVLFFNRVSLFDMELESRTINEVKTEPIEYIYQFWSDDISECVYTFHSMIAMIQIAVYLGFKKIYLVGVDLGFENNSRHMLFDSGLDPHMYTNKARFILDSLSNGVPIRSLINAISYKSLISSYNTYASQVIDSLNLSTDSNHFSSAYRKEPIRHGDTNEQHIKSHTIARRICNDKKIDIYNATFGGELEVYQRVKFDNVV
jgi:hypothetical protein